MKLVEIEPCISDPWEAFSFVNVREVEVVGMTNVLLGIPKDRN